MFEGKRVLANIYGGIQARRHLQRLVDLAQSGGLDLGAMVRRRICLDDVNQGFEAIRDDP